MSKVQQKRIPYYKKKKDLDRKSVVQLRFLVFAKLDLLRDWLGVSNLKEQHKRWRLLVILLVVVCLICCNVEKVEIE